MRSTSAARSPFDADQVGHHVGRAVFAAVDEQPHLGRSASPAADPARRRRRADSAAERISETRADRQAVLRDANLGGALRFAEQRGAQRDVRAGAEPHADAALAAGRDPGRRLLAEHVAGRHFGSGRGASSTRSCRSRLRRQRRWRRRSDLPTRSGTVTWRARTATRMAMPAKRKKVPARAPGEQQDLAVAPDPRSEGCIDNRSMVLQVQGSRAFENGAEEGFEAVAEGQRLVRCARCEKSGRARARNAATTSSFSSGSLEQVL